MYLIILLNMRYHAFRFSAIGIPFAAFFAAEAVISLSGAAEDADKNAI